MLVNNQKYFFLGLYFLIFLLNNCASVSSINGGEKDEEAPIPIAFYPPNGTINFNSNTIKISFNEFITLKNYQKELIITPFVEEYTFNSKKKQVILKFKTPLLDSTTYIINFRSSIVDFNEKNPADNIQYAFSKANFIDSLILEGTAKDPLKLEPPENIVALLYPTQDTLQVREGNPRYIATADTLGHFRLTNLKAGNYFLYLLQDKDGNYKYNTDSEKIGFLIDSITIDTSHQHIELQTIQYDNIEFKLLGTNSLRKYVRLNYNQKIDFYEIAWANDSTRLENIDLDSIFHKTEEKYIQLYKNYSKTIQDSLHLRIIAHNYLGDVDTSEVNIKFNEPKKLTSEEWKYSFQVLPNGALAPKDSIKIDILSSKPILKYDSFPIYQITPIDTIIEGFISKKDSISFDSLKILKKIHNFTFIDSINTFQTDSLSLKVIDTLENSYLMSISEIGLKDTTIIDTLQLAHKLEPNFNFTKFSLPKMKYIENTNLYIKHDALISVENDSSKAKKFSFTFKKSENYGLISGTIVTEKPHFIVELLDKSYKTLYRSRNSENFVFDYVEPGDKYIRIIEDINNNGIWDKGRFLKNIPPEPIFYIPKEIKLKANWEIKDIVVEW